MKWFRNILKGVSFTAAMFVFQACYGTMSDYYDTTYTFHVVSEEGQPLSNVEISCQRPNDPEGLYTNIFTTDEDGFATVWSNSEEKHFHFVDKDSLYKSFDTIIDPMMTEADTINIVLKHE